MLFLLLFLSVESLSRRGAFSPQSVKHCLNQGGTWKDGECICLAIGQESPDHPFGNMDRATWGPFTIAKECPSLPDIELCEAQGGEWESMSDTCACPQIGPEEILQIWHSNSDVKACISNDALPVGNDLAHDSIMKV